MDDNTLKTNDNQGANPLAISAMEAALLADFEHEIRDINLQANGAIRLMMKSRGLTGKYRIENGQFVQDEPQKE